MYGSEYVDMGDWDAIAEGKWVVDWAGLGSGSNSD